jgi:PT repeat
MALQQYVHATEKTAQAIYNPTSQPTNQPTSQPTGQRTCEPSAHEENSKYHFEGGKLAKASHTCDRLRESNLPSTIRFITGMFITGTNDVVKSVSHEFSNINPEKQLSDVFLNIEVYPTNFKNPKKQYISGIYVDSTRLTNYSFPLNDG